MSQYLALCAKAATNKCSFFDLRHTHSCSLHHHRIEMYASRHWLTPTHPISSLQTPHELFQDQHRLDVALALVPDAALADSAVSCSRVGFAGYYYVCMYYVCTEHYADIENPKNDEHFLHLISLSFHLVSNLCLAPVPVKGVQLSGTSRNGQRCFSHRPSTKIPSLPSFAPPKLPKAARHEKSAYGSLLCTNNCPYLVDSGATSKVSCCCVTPLGHLPAPAHFISRKGRCFAKSLSSVME
jgi:hypothetical protein